MRNVKCEFPRCTFSQHAERHHIVPRALGGCLCDENIVPLCPNHHRILTCQKYDVDKYIKIFGKGRYAIDCPKCKPKYEQFLQDLEEYKRERDERIIRVFTAAGWQNPETKP